MYCLRSFVVEGGLVSYGLNLPEMFRQAAGYVNSILRGDKPEDLPVQGPNEIRAADQSQDRQSVRSRNTRVATSPRRRDDRMKRLHFRLWHI
jgi:ABC transporter substrate binding protein